MAKLLWSLKKVSKEWWPRRLSAFRWKRLDFQINIIDGVVFKILYVLEAIVLVSNSLFLLPLLRLPFLIIILSFGPSFVFTNLAFSFTGPGPAQLAVVFYSEMEPFIGL
ncbi:hypothetical protein L1049_001607 [Liquidambar formosana]|uniref:Uncharacterized protein n=1 Tax=Liquidambar formosana TaxID=63359 RepID=A0AAP0R5V8_LIQFO